MSGIVVNAPSVFCTAIVCGRRFRKEEGIGGQDWVGCVVELDQRRGTAVGDSSHGHQRVVCGAETKLLYSSRSSTVGETVLLDVWSFPLRYCTAAARNQTVLCNQFQPDTRRNFSLFCLSYRMHLCKK